MFLGRLVKRIFTRKDNSKDSELKKKTAKITTLFLNEIEPGDIAQPEQFEIQTYEAYDPQSLLEDYLICLSERTTTSSSHIYSNSLDLLSQEKIRMNITPDDFEHIKVIGKGFYGKVTQVRCKKDGAIYALKTIKKSKLTERKNIEHSITERKIMEILHFPFIVELRLAFQTDQKLYFLMDCHTGGELYFHLRLKKRLNESQARFYLSQIVLTLEYIHNKNIIYRDLKPENIILDSKGYIKLTDFGLAKDCIAEDYGCTQTLCGTPEYLSPEMILGEKYGKAVDIWGMGVLFYEMLFGMLPFYDNNHEALYKKILYSEPDLGMYKAFKLNVYTKDLILQLLDKNHKTRITISQVKKHPFFNDIDFSLVYQMKYPPPFIPTLMGDDDYTYIDPLLACEKAEDSLQTGYSPLNKKDFKDFSYKSSQFALNEK